MDLSEMKENKKLVIVIIVVLLLTGLFCYFRFREPENVDVFQPEDGIVNKESTNTVEEAEEEEMIIVHVSGEVKEPGIVKLKEGERIADAIEKAGGATDDADLSKLNLAYVLEDGVKVRIPKKNEGENAGEYVSEESGEEVIQEGSVEAEESTQTTSKVVNINKANQEELMTLPGIGESTAQKIIDYRKENGNFQTIEDIKNVSGIGDSKFNQIKSLIKVK